MSQILNSVTNLIIHIISSLGYLGVGFLMALQTVAVPIPSEVILPFSGYLASAGRFNIFLIALTGGLGSCVGASIAYYIGYKGGRPLVEKYGKYIFLSGNEFRITEQFFAKYHSAAMFFGQLLPIVRSFIAFPAGITKAPYKKFLVYVFLGSFIWSLALAYVGEKLGQNWQTLHSKFQHLDLVVIVLIILGAAFWVYRHAKHK
jgi:membrane protein DedA with SNARE-associated domain